MSRVPDITSRWRPWRRSSRWESIFLEHRERIERAAEQVARRAGLPPQDIEDFVGGVRLKLIDDNYAILRRHRGKSSMSTFLITVVHNSFKDYCNKRFGKYRPSAKAKRLGACGVALERLLVVDQMDLDSAARCLSNRTDLAVDEHDVRQLADQLPPLKAKRRFVGDEALEHLPSADRRQDADRRLLDREHEKTAAKLSTVLSSILQALPAQDLLILKMHLRDGHNLATIADRLRLPRRPLYSRKEKSLSILKAHLEAQGLSWPEVRDLLEWNHELAPAFPTTRDPGTDPIGATP